MNEILTTDEMQSALDSVVDCYNVIILKYTETDKASIEYFINEIALINPCFSLRPDKITAINDSIFMNPVTTQFMLDLSFRFFTLINRRINNVPFQRNSDFFNKLINNLINGLTVDGINTDVNIIPLEIARSCPSNIFNEKPLSFYEKYILRKKKEPSLKEFLENNKHIVLVYLLYLTNQE